MVEVFKTNIQRKEQAKLLLRKLLQAHPFCKINFDLEDCDKILRVEGTDICRERIIQMLNAGGYQCEVLA